MGSSTRLSADAIDAKFRAILIEQLGLEESAIVDEANILHDLGAEEIDLVEITMICEEEFGITLDEDKVDKADTVAKFRKLLISAIGA